jgi:hypothetical protein
MSIFGLYICVCLLVQGLVMAADVAMARAGFEHSSHANVAVGAVGTVAAGVHLNDEMMSCFILTIPFKYHFTQ